MQWAELPQGSVDMPMNSNDNNHAFLQPGLFDPSSNNAASSHFPSSINIPPGSFPMPWPGSPNYWPSDNMFMQTGPSMVPPSISVHELNRSTSQPANKRQNGALNNWSVGHNSRDTLYAHEFLKAFRARLPDSTEGQAACDYCRKRKIKVCTYLY